MKASHCLFLAGVFACLLSSNIVEGAVTLHPGDNIQSMVNANGNNTTFIFSAGTYTNQNITPKAGDIFDGQGVAMLYGSNVTTRAFGGAVANVTIQNLTIQNYSSASKNAAVDCSGGSGWIVSNCVIQLNASVGVKFGTNSLIINNQISANGEEGFAGGGSGWSVKNNLINYNNTTHQSWSADAGGGKVTGGTNGAFIGNTAMNNDGPGIWLYGDADGIVIKSNVCIGNFGPGILIEISKEDAVSNNVCIGNGFGATNWNGGQIVLSTSPSNTVSGNTVGVPVGNSVLYGIFVMDEARTNGSGAAVHAVGNDVSGNGAWFWNTNAGIQGCGTDDSYTAVYANNHFHDNSYHVTNTAVKYFAWETNDTLAQAQANNHETGSTLDTNTTPRLDLSKTNSLFALNWPAWAINFKAWSATNLISPVSWTPVSRPITVTNDESSLTLTSSNSAGYFRLLESEDSLAMGLVAHYTFDEQCTNATPGCVLDISGLGNNGTLGNATSGTNPQAPLWTPDGKFGGAYLYNGIVLTGNIVATVGEGIYLPQGVDVDGNWTLSVWALLNDVTNHTSCTIYCQKQSTEDCRNLLIHWEGDMDQTMTLQVRDSSCHELILHNLPENPMVAGEWFHLVGVGSNKTYSFYINGQLQASQLVTNMGSLSCDSHTIGVMFDDFGRYYNHYDNGAIDELRIYSRALSPAEVLSLYNRGGAP